ncbi:MAG: EAL domain-containing protein [Pseudomonadota bacterium]
MTEKINRTDRDRFLAFAFATADLLIEIDADGELMKFVAGACQTILNYKPKELVDRRVVDVIAVSDRPRVHSALRSIKAGRRMQPLRIQFLNREGKPVDAVLAGFRMPDSDDSASIHVSANFPRGNQISFVGSLGDDRGAEFVSMEDMIALATGESVASEGLSMTLLDLDGLSDIDDPEASAEITDNLLTLLQSGEVGSKAIGKLGEDRFGVLHPEWLKAEDLTSKVNKTVKASHPAAANIETKTKAIELEQDDLSKSDAQRALQYAMEQFASAENTEEFELDSLYESVAELTKSTAERMTELRSVINSNGFKLVFQPIVDLKTKRTSHVEALSRLADGSSAHEALTLAESTGVIEDFDLAVLKQALEQVDQANQNGVRPMVAVNISGRSLQSNMFVQAVIDLMDINPTTREQIILEVTETSEIKDLNAVNEILQEFRSRKNKVCIDDFGSGAAAFQYLRTLDVDVVKIDGSYIDRILYADRDRALVLAIQRLCAELGIQTVAEKVEMPDQAQILRTVGIDKGQGWLFGKPEDNLDKFFKKKRTSITQKELLEEKLDGSSSADQDAAADEAASASA